MHPLNALDAVAPAFTRTHQTLFQPFRLGRSWKLAASSYLGFLGSMFIPLPLLFLFIPASVFGEFGSAHSALQVVNAIISLICLVILYFCARMELVVFEMVVTRSKFIAPMWRRYGSRVWPWIGLKVVVGTFFTVVVVALLLAPLRHMIDGLRMAGGWSGMPFPGSAGSPPDPQVIQAMLAPVLSRMVSLQVTLLGVMLLLKIPSTLLNDFVMPFYLLEDIPLVAAMQRGFKIFLVDPVQVILYLILKPILFMIGTIIQNIALAVAMIPLILILGIGAIIAGLTLHHSGPGSGLLFVAAAVVFYTLCGAVMFYLSVFMAGYLMTLLEAYGICFLAGRYPLLGDLIEPGPGKPFTPPPVFPSDEERNDEDGGPPMPMNPAVA